MDGDKMTNDEKSTVWGKQYKEEGEIYNKIFATFGISDSANRVLYSVCEKEGGCSQNDICDEWFMPKQTTNSAVLSLVKKGLVEQRQCDGKGNRKIIVLTKQGNEFCDKTIRRLIKAEKKAFFKLSDDEAETLIKLYSKYLNFLRDEFNKL